MFGYIFRVALRGAAYTAATSLAVGVCFSVAWGGGLAPSLILVLPSFVIAGAIDGYCIFAAAGLIVCVIRKRYVAGSSMYAFLGGLLSLPLLLYWISWISGGILLSLNGSRGFYQILLPGVLAVSAAGVFVGWRLRTPSHSRA